MKLPYSYRETTVKLPSRPLPAYPYRSVTLSRDSSYWRVGIGTGLLFRAAHELVSKAIHARPSLQIRGAAPSLNPPSAFAHQPVPRQPAHDRSLVTRLRALRGMPSRYLPTQCRHAMAAASVMPYNISMFALDHMTSDHGIPNVRSGRCSPGDASRGAGQLGHGQDQGRRNLYRGHGGGGKPKSIWVVRNPPISRIDPGKSELPIPERPCP